MNDLVQIYKSLKQIAPEAICISKASPQGGVYLLFDGIKSVAWKKDRASFRIIFVTKIFDRFWQLACVTLPKK